MNTPHRLLAATVATGFLGVAIAFWITPRATAAVFALQPAGERGLVSLCADLGGLFLGMGTLAGFGALTRRPGALRAAAAVVGAVAFGRVLGWLLHARAPLAPELLVELGALTVLLVCAREREPGR